MAIMVKASFLRVIQPCASTWRTLSKAETASAKPNFVLPRRWASMPVGKSAARGTRAARPIRVWLSKPWRALELVK